jgi:hypothetical protein
MPCSEFQKFAAAIESKRQAYTYIRLQESKVALSKTRYDELVQEAYAALTEAIKDSLRHRKSCAECRKEQHTGGSGSGALPPLSG